MTNDRHALCLKRTFSLKLLTVNINNALFVMLYHIPDLEQMWRQKNAPSEFKNVNVNEYGGALNEWRGILFHILEIFRLGKY